jgi:hypothetical protein
MQKQPRLTLVHERFLFWMCIGRIKWRSSSTHTSADDAKSTSNQLLFHSHTPPWQSMTLSIGEPTCPCVTFSSQDDFWIRPQLYECNDAPAKYLSQAALSAGLLNWLDSSSQTRNHAPFSRFLNCPAWPRQYVRHRAFPPNCFLWFLLPFNFALGIPPFQLGCDSPKFLRGNFYLRFQEIMLLIIFCNDWFYFAKSLDSLVKLLLRCKVDKLYYILVLETIQKNLMSEVFN